MKEKFLCKIILLSIMFPHNICFKIKENLFECNEPMLHIINISSFIAFWNCSPICLLNQWHIDVYLFCEKVRDEANIVSNLFQKLWNLPSQLIKQFLKFLIVFNLNYCFKSKLNVDFIIVLVCYAVVIKYHKLGGLNNNYLLSLSSGG